MADHLVRGHLAPSSRSFRAYKTNASYDLLAIFRIPQRFHLALTLMQGSRSSLPGFLLAKSGDVGCVVASVPSVKKSEPVDGAFAVFRMDEHAAEIFGFE